MTEITEDRYPNIYQVLSYLAEDILGFSRPGALTPRYSGRRNLDLVEQQLSTLKDDKTVFCPMWRFAAPTDNDEKELKPGRGDAWFFLEEMVIGEVGSLYS